MSARARLVTFVSVIALGALGVTPSNATPSGPSDVSDFLIPDGPVTTDVDPRLKDATGKVSVVVGLADQPLAVAQGKDAKQRGAALSKGQAVGLLRQLDAKQDTLTEQVGDLGGREVARVSKALNAVVYEVDAARIAAIADLPGVMSIRPVGEYELDLSETVPYIGAGLGAAEGLDGSGVTVAVLDSGIDYTHAAFGGAGTSEAYGAAYGSSLGDPRNTTRDGLFPTSKVVAGYDFVGESWPNGDRTSDEDPIDCGPSATGGCAGGHGTHVADIIAGGDGVAPGASLLAVKVCSAVSSSCNGVALLLGMDYALDPNDDADISDAADVINLSLGSSYGQREDDLSFATANAVRMGVSVVASAGNSADRPYITGSPASTPEVISVAQTQVPSASSIPLVVNSPAAIAGTYPNTSTVDWAPIGEGFTGDVQAAGLACTALPAGSLTGKVALVDRGSCAISLKTEAASDAGAVGVLVANNAAGDAPSFSYGGGDGLRPTLIITQSTGGLIKSALASGPVDVSVSPASSIPLAGSMVASSARGPSYSDQAIKPDIGAPGASISAVSGTGTGTEAFGGTSGAAPMVAGAAALLIDQDDTRTPNQVKALLMNNADTEVYTNPSTQPGVLAPITRIGGGELRVDAAAASSTLAWDSETQVPSLSFGYHAVTRPVSLKKSVTVRNDGPTARTYSISPDFRFADDAASGAVSFKVPGSLTVPARSSRSFAVQLRIDADKLPVWTLNGGASGGDGALLQTVEFDGYLTLTNGGRTTRMPWHVLPHRAAAVAPSTGSVALTEGAGSVTLSNGSAAHPGRVEVFALTGESPKISSKVLPQAGDNFATIDLKSVGVRQAGGTLQFAVNTFGERAHPNYPAEFDVYVDTDANGSPDFVIYTLENGGFAATGQNVVYVQDLASGRASAYFFTIADLNSANAILTVPLSALAVTAATQIQFSVYAFDNYFTGGLTDAIEGMTFTPAAPRYTTSAQSLTVPAGGTAALGITAPAGGVTASPSQKGVLLMYSDAKPSAEASAIRVTP
ncbi:peptidase S8 [Nocardioides sp. S5]|uniref:S8 family serine peptidase n=1 Tax=Nocardioides sp. S5 TaxID=2017486 RepID=UPI001A8FAA93|nr:S8 family serine peptidase [Nocardioides sp. S5]QSR30634.1 peptidase S8 [Nocardioides sp. S5]